MKQKSTKNKFEASVAKLLPGWNYESTKLPYTLHKNYIPDFISADDKIIIESKGFLRSDDRSKMLAVKQQHPEWRIIFVFQAPNRTISKTSKTTYAAWALKHGFDVATVDTLLDVLGGAA